MQTATEQKYPVAIFELIPINKIGSGFEREDTLNLPEEKKVRLIHPKRRVVMNESVIRKESEKHKGTFVNVPTRFMYNQEEILKDKQDAENLKVNLIMDKIVFINGLLTVPKDGAFVGLYEFLTTHAQNLSNPNRIESLQPVFKEIKPAEEAHDKNIYDLQMGEAMGIILKLAKENKGKYEYNEDAINTLCASLNVYAESTAQQVSALIAFAKAKPVDFLNAAKQGQQTVAIEIKHAMQLGLIKIDGTAIVYTDGGSIKKCAPAQNTEEKKLAGLGSFFQRVEGKEAYDLFKANLAAAKEAALA